VPGAVIVTAETPIANAIRKLLMTFSRFSVITAEA
jgi:hypothetical protein